MNTDTKNKIIVAPLNWGWGHATRCVPIIHQIKSLGYTPVLACDGGALLFLKKEFPELEILELPSYKIKYFKYFKLGMFLNMPNIIKAVLKEQKVIDAYVQSHSNKVLGIISDNRLGVYSKSIKSIYITHQLNIKAGVLSFLMNKIHHFYIKKHKECWVPDEVDSKYSGHLSKCDSIKANFIGILSRFQKKELEVKYDLLVLLSGIEGQRRVLEKLISRELKHYKGRVLVVRGSFGKELLDLPDTIEVVDYLLSNELENAINSSRMVLSRSGYSTVMDLAKLNKPAFYIPTPGQTEQEYLATYLKEKNYASTATQNKFSIAMLTQTKNVENPILNKDPQHFLKKELKRFF